MQPTIIAAAPGSPATFAPRPYAQRSQGPKAGTVQMYVIEEIGSYMDMRLRSVSTTDGVLWNLAAYNVLLRCTISTFTFSPHYAGQPTTGVAAKRRAVSLPMLAAQDVDASSSVVWLGNWRTTMTTAYHACGLQLKLKFPKIDICCCVLRMNFTQLRITMR